MRHARRWIGTVALAVMALSGIVNAHSATTPDAPAVITPPDSLFEMVREQDREAARRFYKKYIDVKGMPVVASSEVADLALQRTYSIVTHLLAGRPDVLEAMIKNRMYLIIIGKDQVYSDMPEYRNHPNPAYQNERVRGTGGKPTSFGEENLLSLPLDRYDDESIGVHEFCHTIDGTLRSIDPTWSERKNGVYRKAIEKGLWKNTYARSNPCERKMFAYRHDMLKALIADGVKLVVLGENEKPGDLPEFKSAAVADVERNVRFLDYAPDRKLLVVSEENLFNDAKHPLIGDGQVIRVFAGAVYNVCGTRPVDTNWEKRGRDVQQYELRVKRLDVQFDQKLKQLHNIATGKGLWKGTPAGKDRVEYWIAGVLAYFDARGRDAVPNEIAHPVGTRETLKEYDPDLYALVNETMAYDGHLDWRYQR